MISQFLNGQVNFPKSNSTWSVFDRKYFVQGDSTINDKVYSKFYLSKNLDKTEEVLVALLREDENERKVYAIPNGKTQENLLYDFSLEIDSLTTVFPITFYCPEGGVTVKVQQIDTIMLGDKPHRRQKIIGGEEDTNLGEYWIEGIGSTFGPFNSGITGVLIFDFYYPTLICFENNNNLIFDNPNFESCYEAWPVSIPDNNFENIIKIWPIPTREKVNIESRQKILGIWLTTITGQKVKIQAQNELNNIVDLSGLNNGIYVLTIRTKNGLTTKKIIKNGL